jgi:hypothetical protein
VLTTGPKVCRFKHRRGNLFLKAIKICSTPSFGGDVKPSAPCAILQHVKEPLCEVIMHPINAQVFQKYPCPFIINDHIYMPKYQCSASHVQYTVMLIHGNNSPCTVHSEYAETCQCWKVSGIFLRIWSDENPHAFHHVLLQ